MCVHDHYNTRDLLNYYAYFCIQEMLKRYSIQIYPLILLNKGYKYWTWLASHNIWYRVTIGLEVSYYHRHYILLLVDYILKNTYTLLSYSLFISQGIPHMKAYTSVYGTKICTQLRRQLYSIEAQNSSNSGYIFPVEHTVPLR